MAEDPPPGGTVDEDLELFFSPRGEPGWKVQRKRARDEVNASPEAEKDAKQMRTDVNASVKALRAAMLELDELMGKHTAPIPVAVQKAVHNAVMAFDTWEKAARQGGDGKMDQSSQTMSQRSLKELDAAKKIWLEVDAVRSVKDLLPLVEKEWPQSAFRVTRMEKRSILTGAETKAVILDPKDEASKAVRTGLCVQFPLLRTILEKPPAAGSVVKVVRQDTAWCDGQRVSAPPGSLLVAFATKGDAALADCMELVKRVGEAVPEGGRLTLACQMLAPGHLRKVVECALRGRSVPVSVCADKVKDPPAGKKEKIPVRKPRAVKERGEALMVTGEGKSFAEVLKNIRGTVKGQDTEILAITKESDGAKIVLKKGDVAGVEKLQRAIRAAHPEIRAEVRVPKTTFLIQGLDAEVTKEEVEGAVQDLLGGATVAPKVRYIRARAGDTRTATVEVTAVDMAKIAESARIRIGPVWGRVAKAVVPKEDHCFKCWGTGHMARGCKGPDRTALCYRCGLEGHKAAECANALRCITCGKAGHRTGSAICERREVSQQERQETRTSGGESEGWRTAGGGRRTHRT